MLSRLFAKTGKNLKGSVKLARPFSQKLGIADALTVLEDKISNISQLVRTFSHQKISLKNF